MTHPDDDTGDALRRLEADGDDLSRPRDIDFAVVFPDQTTAESFAEHFRREGYKTVVKFAQVEEAHPWDVTVAKAMVPSHAAITAFENELEEIAKQLGGYNDGWGCFALPGKHIQ